MRPVRFRYYPELERKARRERACHDKAGIFEHHAAAVPALLENDVAEDTALLELVILARPAQFLLHAER